MANDPAQTRNVRLYALRMRAGLSSRELAEAAGVGQTTILAAEHGVTPHPGNQRRIAAALDRVLRMVAHDGGEPTPDRLDPIDLWPIADADEVVA
jgi:transcriptional regulator with XRE-family HTH domain